jgi:hypothetical protein
MALEHATLTNLSTFPTPAPVKVQFNPTDYGVDYGAVYADQPVPSLAMPLLQFVRGESRILSVDLLLDGTDKRQSAEDKDTVIGQLTALRQFVLIDDKLHSPPVCQFQWKDVKFEGVVTSLKEKYSLFDESGRILRAKVTISMKSYQAPEVQLRELRRQSPDRTRMRLVRDGETLAQIADEAYGDPRLWRVLAAANDIDRPRFLRSGSALRIPALTSGGKIDVAN